MSTAITETIKQIRVTDVQQVFLTEISDDAGRKVRAIRIFGSPTPSGGLPTLEILMDGAESGNLKVTTPDVSF